MRQSKFQGVIMDKFFETMFQLIYPLHSVKGGKTGMFSRILYVRERVESQKFWRATEFSSFSVKILLKIVLLFFEFFFGARSVLLVVVRVVDVNYKVDAQIKLEFLCLEILLHDLFRWHQQLLPSFEKVVFRAMIKTKRESVQKWGCVQNWFATSSLCFEIFNFALISKMINLFYLPKVPVQFGWTPISSGDQQS